MPLTDESNPPLPAPPCETCSPELVMESLRELRGHARKTAERIEELHTAFVGNPALGHTGLVARVTIVENKVEKHDRKLLVWGSTIAVFVTGAGWAIQIIFR